MTAPKPVTLASNEPVFIAAIAKHLERADQHDRIVRKAMERDRGGT